MLDTRYVDIAAAFKYRREVAEGEITAAECADQYAFDVDAFKNWLDPQQIEVKLAYAMTDGLTEADYWHRPGYQFQVFHLSNDIFVVIDYVDADGKETAWNLPALPWPTFKPEENHV